MKGSAAIKNYRASARKNRWRRLVWHRIASLLEHRVSTANVVGLFGCSGEDAMAAMVEGFQPKNMLSIDISRSVSSVNRRHGITSVTGTLSECMKFMPRNEIGSIDVVYADMCGNLDGFQQLRPILASSPFLRLPAVLCVNLLRGRETRRAILNHGKHRGLVAELMLQEKFMLSEQDAAIKRIINAMYTREKNIPLLGNNSEFSCAVAQALSDFAAIRQESIGAGWSFSYPSGAGTQYMDSCVCLLTQTESYKSCYADIPKWSGVRPELAYWLTRNYDSDGVEKEEGASFRRRLAAARAIYTRQMA